MQLTEQEIVRREKLQKLRALGINPYPAALFPVNTMSTEIEQNYVGSKTIYCLWKAHAKKVAWKSLFC